jgi:hypothetical protein
MGKNTKTKTVIEEATAIDYENVKVDAEVVSISVSVAKIITIEIILLIQAKYANSITHRLGPWFPLLEIGSICLQRSV